MGREVYECRGFLHAHIDNNLTIPFKSMVPNRCLIPHSNVRISAQSWSTRCKENSKEIFSQTGQFFSTTFITLQYVLFFTDDADASESCMRFELRQTRKEGKKWWEMRRKIKSCKNKKEIWGMCIIHYKNHFEMWYYEIMLPWRIRCCVINGIEQKV